MRPVFASYLSPDGRPETVSFGCDRDSTHSPRSSESEPSASVDTSSATSTFRLSASSPADAKTATIVTGSPVATYVNDAACDSNSEPVPCSPFPVFSQREKTYPLFAVAFSDTFARALNVAFPPDTLPIVSHPSATATVTIAEPSYSQWA